MYNAKTIILLLLSNNFKNFLKVERVESGNDERYNNIKDVNFDGYIEMPPFKLTLNPRSFFTASNCKSITMWKMYRILQHLWTGRAIWAMGFGFNSMGEGLYPKQSEEASIRLGNAYTAKPKHLNVISEYLASIRHADENYSKENYNDSFNILPSQTSILTMVTETRSMDISVSCRTDSDSLWYNENHLESDDDVSDDDDDDDDVRVIVSNTTKSSGYLDWMTPVGNIVAGAGGLVGLGNGNGNDNENEFEKRRKAEKRVNRQNEKKLMIARIKELEAKVALLEKK
jgi:hypothetical protein